MRKPIGQNRKFRVATIHTAQLFQHSIAKMVTKVSGASETRQPF